MSETWILVSIFANACILVHSYKDEIPEFLRHLENTNGVNARRVYMDIMNHPTRKSKIEEVTLYERLFKPGQSHEDLPTLDPPVNPLKYLPQTTTNPFESLNLNINEALLPETNFGKIPGPGSQNRYPNGIRITYNNLPGANGRGPGTGDVPTGFHPNSPDIQGILSKNEYSIPGKFNHALRMGDQDQGMAGGPPPEYMEQGERPWMENKDGNQAIGIGLQSENMQGEALRGIGYGPPREYMQRGLSPWMGNAPPPGYKPGGASPMMGKGSPSWNMQGLLGAAPPPGYTQKDLPPGLGGGSLPAYLQRGPPSVMEDGPPPEYMQGAHVPEGGSLPGYKQGGPIPGVKGPVVEYSDRKNPTGMRNGFPTWLKQSTETEY